MDLFFGLLSAGNPMCPIIRQAADECLNDGVLPRLWVGKRFQTCDQFFALHIQQFLVTCLNAKGSIPSNPWHVCVWHI
jgi:hypothetical protein